MDRRNPRRPHRLNLLKLLTLTVMLVGGSQALPATATAFTADCTDENWILCEEGPSSGSNPVATPIGVPSDGGVSGIPGETIYVEGETPYQAPPAGTGGLEPGDGDLYAPLPDGALPDQTGGGPVASDQPEAKAPPKRKSGKSRDKVLPDEDKLLPEAQRNKQCRPLIADWNRAYGRWQVLDEQIKKQQERDPDWRDPVLLQDRRDAWAELSQITDEMNQPELKCNDLDKDRPARRRHGR